MIIGESILPSKQSQSVSASDPGHTLFSFYHFYLLDLKEQDSFASRDGAGSLKTA